MDTRTRPADRHRPLAPIGWRTWLKIRWDARRIADPDEWESHVRFHEMLAANRWDDPRLDDLAA